MTAPAPVRTEDGAIRCEAVVDNVLCAGRMRVEASPFRPFLAEWVCTKCRARRPALDVELAGVSP